MHISQLQIRNFRNFLSSRFEFRKGVNTLIGENGSGKTNALYALRLLLDENLYRNATHLRESDFCRALRDWRGHWVIVSINFEELDPAEGCQFLKHDAGHMDETDEGTHTFFFRPKLDVRRHLHSLSTNEAEKAEIRAYLDELSLEDYEPVLTGRATADFLDDDVYASIVGDFDSLEFPNPDLDDQTLVGVRMHPIHPEISCTFAPALRDVVADLRRYRSNPLLGLLRGTGSAIHLDDAERISATVDGLNADIATLPEIQEIATGVQSTLYSTVGHTYSPMVSVESSLSSEIETLLQRLTITVGDDSSTNYRGDLSEQSLGGANLIYLALKLLEYEVKLSSDRAAHFLLLEEPEAHIHTHIQKTLFENQEARKTQVILSTHSTHVSSVSRVGSMNILSRKPDHVEIFQPATGLESEDLVLVERYLDATRSTLLFAKGVILVEGHAELVAIPAMVKACFGVSVDELGLSVVAMDSAFFEHIAALFHPDRVRRRCAIVTDLDTSLLVLPEAAEDDDSDQKHARAAQAAGAARSATLEDFTRGNPWVQTFFGKHTFEADFLLAGNQDTVIGTLESIYTIEHYKNESAARIRSDDYREAGCEVLRLAAKVGKGWFGLLLSEVMPPNSIVPDNILRALAFAVGDLDAEVLRRAARYRIEKGAVQAPEANDPLDPAELDAMDVTEFRTTFADLFPTDNLARLISHL